MYIPQQSCISSHRIHAGADGRSVDGASVASTEKASVTLRVQPAPMLGNDRTRGVLRRGHNVSMHSRLSTAIDGASDDGKSGIMLTNGAGSSIHGGRTWEDMREDAVDVDTLDPVCSSLSLCLSVPLSFSLSL